MRPTVWPCVSGFPIVVAGRLRSPRGDVLLARVDLPAQLARHACERVELELQFVEA